MLEKTPPSALQPDSPDTLKRKEAAQKGALTRKLNKQIKTVGYEETPPEAYEEFGRDAESAKKNAESYGFTVTKGKPTAAAPAVEIKTETEPQIKPVENIVEEKAAEPKVAVEGSIETEKERQDKIKLAAFNAQQDKAKEWREHYSPLAEIQEDIEKQEAVSRARENLEKELADEVSKINQKDAKIDEAEGLLKEVARRSNQEALTKQVDEDLKIATGEAPLPGTVLTDPNVIDALTERVRQDRQNEALAREVGIFKPSPEQQRGLDRLKAAAKQEAAVGARAEKLGFLGTIKRIKEKYDDKSLRTQVAISEGLWALGSKKRLGNVLKIGAAAGIAYLLYEALVGSGTTQQPADTFNSRFYFDVPKDAPVEAPPVVPAPVEAPPSIPTLEIFGSDSVVERGGTVWGFTEEQLNSQPEFAALDQIQKTRMLKSYEIYTQGLGTSAIKAMGISSGDIHTIRIGEHIDLTALNGRSLFDSFITDARNLTQEQRASIAYNLEHNIR